jgi:pimeloyl-ACP methyl ester carboxylesterase
MPVVHLLPGFTLDRACYSKLNLPEEQFRFTDFIPVEGNETLPEYALRMAEAMKFKSGDIVGGHSLGGMLALEIARQRHASKVLLLSSCTHRRFVHQPFRTSMRLARLTPVGAMRSFFIHLPVFLRGKGLYDLDSEQFIREIVERFPTELFQTLPGLVVRWKGCEPAAPCAAMHAENDWLIRPPSHLPGLKLLPGSHHIIMVSQPEAVRNFLMEQAN